MEAVHRSDPCTMKVHSTGNQETLKTCSGFYGLPWVHLDTSEATTVVRNLCILLRVWGHFVSMALATVISMVILNVYCMHSSAVQVGKGAYNGTLIEGTLASKPGSPEGAGQEGKESLVHTDCECACVKL